MKKVLFASLLVLPLCALPAQASGWRLSFCVDAGMSGWFRVKHGCGNWCGIGCPPSDCGGGGGAQLGPWYSYWPMEAHFVVPAPTGYPYYPSPMTSSMFMPHAAPVATGPAAYAPSPHSFQTAGFHAPAPSYWYSGGR